VELVNKALLNNDPMADPLQLEVARRQIEFARQYTQQLIADIDDEDWFRIPDSGVSHVAWQVGHLAMAQYMLTLFRLRGKRAEDEAMISKTFIRTFLKGTTPVSDADKYPAAKEIREVFHRVHETVIKELAVFPPEDLDEKVVEPYVGYETRLGSLLFCAAHEMLHAGQIGALRRQLGKAPVR